MRSGGLLSNSTTLRIRRQTPSCWLSECVDVFVGAFGADLIVICAWSEWVPGEKGACIPCRYEPPQPTSSLIHGDGWPADSSVALIYRNKTTLYIWLSSLEVFPLNWTSCGDMLRFLPECHDVGCVCVCTDEHNAPLFSHDTLQIQQICPFPEGAHFCCVSVHIQGFGKFGVCMLYFPISVDG